MVLGSHCTAEAVLVRYRDYRELLESQSPVAHTSMLEQLIGKRDLIRRLAMLNNIGAISVFGSVARGDERSTSDIDLLVEPTGSTSLFDLAQVLVDAQLLVDRGHEAYGSDLALPLACEALSNRAGDLSKRLRAADPQRFTEEIWSQAARNRDFVMHQYHRVDADLLWTTVVRDFPRIAELVEEQLRPRSPSTGG